MLAHNSRLLVRTTFGTLRTTQNNTAPTCVRIITHVQRRVYYLDSVYIGPGQTHIKHSKTEFISPQPGVSHRNQSVVAISLKGQRRPLCRYDFLDPGEVEENTRKALACRHIRRFIVNPHLARLLVGHLERDLEDGKAVVFDCNPGPGVLTQALLSSGAQRVVALESDKSFLPDLQALESRADGQLEVVHCDFFKLDPLGQGTMKPPSMYSDKLFNGLGIAEVPWTADVPVKVVGFFPQRNERSMMWKMIYSLLERSSVFRYGRVELNMFMSEKEYLKLVASPAEPKKYQSLGVLWQVACDIELLHKEPWTSFVASTKTTKRGDMGVQKMRLPDGHVCLVRLTPRQDLFNSHLTPANGAALIMMVKQCLTKRKAVLIDQLNSWSPESGESVLTELGLLEDTQTGQVYPEEYRNVFEKLQHSKEFTQSWLYEETLNSQATAIL